MTLTTDSTGGPCSYTVFPSYQLLPRTCPVCFGRGTVPNGFYSGCGMWIYSSDAALERCRSCWGRGIVWG